MAATANDTQAKTGLFETTFVVLGTQTIYRISLYVTRCSFDW